MQAGDTPDLLAALAPPPPVPIRPETPAMAALAMGCAHYHAMTFPNRTYPSERWLDGYAESQGLRQAAVMLRALDKLTAEQRAAIAAHLARVPA